MRQRAARTLLPGRLGTKAASRCRVAYRGCMATSILGEKLKQLEECRYRFGRHDAPRIERLLNSLAKSRFSDAAALIRFHEALVFLRAFPQTPAVLRAAERLLNSFHKRVEA